jgi:hypothetical protein
MRDLCDFCDQPATATCSATDCENVMCNLHTTTSMAARTEPLPTGDIPASQVQAFCPDHKHLANA